MTAILRVARFSLTSADPERLARFYVETLGFEQAGIAQGDAEPYGVPGRVTTHRLRLGLQEIELACFEQAGAPYPAASTSHDAWFQHLALVTTDMTAAHARVSASPGWQTITEGGQPVRLPASSGGVTAFKFRDPEGHPLELLAFPAGSAPAPWAGAGGAAPCVGIDHSAMAVADGARAIAFYGGLGLSVSARSLNQGPEQQTLDAAPGVEVAVTGLAPTEAPPHLELLAYQRPAIRPGIVGPSDVACTRSILVPHDPDDAGRMLVDPDGHILMLAAG